MATSIREDFVHEGCQVWNPDVWRNNLYDGHTLAQALTTIEQITQVSVTSVFVDKAVGATTTTAI